MANIKLLSNDHKQCIYLLVDWQSVQIKAICLLIRQICYKNLNFV